jgi:hypothetical protein
LRSSEAQAGLLAVSVGVYWKLSRSSKTIEASESFSRIQAFESSSRIQAFLSLKVIQIRKIDLE